MQNDPFYIEREDHYKSGKMIGGFIPRHLAGYLRILTVYHNRSLQSILLEAIESWIDGQEPEQSVLIALADRAHVKWRQHCLENRKDPEWNTVRGRSKQFTRYKKDIHERLERKKLSLKHIEAILAELHRLRKAHQHDEGML